MSHSQGYPWNFYLINNVKIIVVFLAWNFVKPNNYLNFSVVEIRNSKELCLCHKLCCANSYIFATRWRRPLIFQIMISVRSNNLSLKYQRFKPLGSKDYIFRIRLEHLSLWQRLNSFVLRNHNWKVLNSNRKTRISWHVNHFKRRVTSNYVYSPFTVDLLFEITSTVPLQ